MQDVSFGVGDWARERTIELADQFRRADIRPLADLSHDDLERLDRKARDILMLLRAHLSYCVRQAVPGHPLAMANDHGTIDLKQMRVEIDAVITEIADARAQIKWNLQRDPATSIVAPHPERVHEQISAEERILELEKRRRTGQLNDVEFASALRAVLLSDRT